MTLPEILARLERLEQQADSLLQGIDHDAHRWRQCYEMGDGAVHWGLETAASAKDGKVVDAYTVLLADFPKAMDGRAVSEQPYPKLMAAAPTLVRELALALSAAREALSAQGWQPIASAPKDGTEILVVFGSSPGLAIACYDDQEGWLDSSGGISTGIHLHEVTCWMPLPDLPASPADHLWAALRASAPPTEDR